MSSFPAVSSFSAPRLHVSAASVLLQVVSPTISSPVCQEQLVEAGKLVDRSVESCVQACLSATEDGELLKQVSFLSAETFSFTPLRKQITE